MWPTVLPRCTGGRARVMRAVVWKGKRDVAVESVTDPSIDEPTDAIIRVTSAGVCGSDLHLYEVMAAWMDEGDVLGHEPIGVVEALGAGATNLSIGDRVVVPFQIACGACFMCAQGLQTQCETTQVHEHDRGAAIYGYSRLYGQIPGAQAEYLRVRRADYNPIPVPHGPPDDRFVYLSDVLPTAWQAVRYADIPAGGSVVVLGLGPIGDMCCRVAGHLGAATVIGIDLVPERLARVRSLGHTVLDLANHPDVVGAVRSLTDGRGPDAVIDAVGMEAHGATVGRLAQQMTSLLPDSWARVLMERVGLDRLSALYLAIELVRRGGTVSLSGVYGGQTDPLPMLTLFDKQIQLRMGQANVRRWLDDLLPLVTGDDDPLGVDTFATHRLPLDEASRAYSMFQHKEDGCVKVLLQP
jgi:threonine dehydrogenase-like Zn-dependent dehydrogenase